MKKEQFKKMKLKTNCQFLINREKAKKQKRNEKIALKVGTAIILSLKYLLIIAIVLIICSFDGILDLIIK